MLIATAPFVIEIHSLHKDALECRAYVNEYVHAYLLNIIITFNLNFVLVCSGHNMLTSQ